jgi:Ca2+:H+ antiporter
MSDSAVEKGHGQVQESLPMHNDDKTIPQDNGNSKIRAEGQSGRRGFHPRMVLAICFKSSCTLSKYVNILWPFVPVALALVSLEVVQQSYHTNIK